MDLIELEVVSRSAIGSGAAGRLRRANMIPGVVYGEGKPAVMLAIDGMVYGKKVAGHPASQLFRLTSSDSALNGLLTLVKDVQIEALKSRVLHVDLLSVTEGKTIHVTVPLTLLGEPVSVKHGETILNQTLWEIDIECLPTAIPDEIRIDVSGLNEGDAIHASDLTLPEGVKLLTEPELAVLSVIGKREEVIKSGGVATEAGAAAEVAAAEESKAKG